MCLRISLPPCTPIFQWTPNIFSKTWQSLYSNAHPVSLCTNTILVVNYFSVADPGCLIQVRIPDPDYCPSRIPDLRFRIQNSNKREGWKNLLSYILRIRQYHNIKNNFIFEQVKKKLWANLQKIIELFTPKTVIKLSKIWKYGTYNRCVPTWCPP